MLNTNKRSTMTLFSGASDPYSHRVRIVLAEKDVTVDIVDIDSSNQFLEELASFNPYCTVPTLVDREVVLYQSEIVMEYLDERYPHPPLMPVYPTAKGRTRLMMYRVNKDWYSLMDAILDPEQPPEEIEQYRKSLTESLMSITPIFAEMPYFVSEEFSLIDCCIAPLLWRLPQLGIKLPEQAHAIESYAQRLFKRESFQASLTNTERMMRT